MTLFRQLAGSPLALLGLCQHTPAAWSAESTSQTSLPCTFTCFFKGWHKIRMEEILLSRQGENKHLEHWFGRAAALNVPNMKRNNHLKCPIHWETTAPLAACSALSSHFRGWIFPTHRMCGAFSSHLPYNVSKGKELTLVLSRVPVAAVLKKRVRREGISVD